MVKVALADLTHTGQIVAANTLPLGISLIAAYGQLKLGARAEFALYRYPADFSAHLATEIPRIVGFSNCSWNFNLSYEYARLIKERAPDTVVVFGGPNYPNDSKKRHELLASHPAIDFHIDGEGEEAFVGLFEALEKHEFDVAALKKTRPLIPNTDFVADGKFSRGPMLPRMTDINAIPSPYLAGLNDKFFDDVLIPMMQTSRGCPYSCTFCHEGSLYFNKVKTHDPDRIAQELAYIAERVRTPDFIIVDSNFGMFEQDIQTCHEIAKLQKIHDWPRYVFVATAKNHKERVVQAAAILPGIMNPGAAIQSTNETVLANIKRKNLPIQAVVDVGKTSEEQNANSFSEVILCLPGDTKEAHYQSVFDMIDVGINYVRMYQFMLLPGTEADTPEYRARFGMQTRWRVLPRCFGRYEVLGESIDVAEMEEICISNSTMSFQDYLDCRAFDLTIEVFYNGGIFFELIQLLKRLGIKPSTLLLRIHERLAGDEGLFKELYKSYRDDELKNQWDSRESIDSFFGEPGVYEKYVDGEYGSNEIYAYRATFLFQRMQDVHDAAFDAARDVIRSNGVGANAYQEYLEELQDYSYRRKFDMLQTEAASEGNYTFDFVKLTESNFNADPLDLHREGGMKLKFEHDDWQKKAISGYLAQYGDSINGLGRILLRSHVKRLYRQVDYAVAEKVAQEAGAQAIVEAGARSSSTLPV